MTASSQQFVRYKPYNPHPLNMSSTDSSDSEASPDGGDAVVYIPYNTKFQQVSAVPSEKLPIVIDSAEISSALPLWAELQLSEKLDSPFTPYITQDSILPPPRNPSPEEETTKGVTYLPRFQQPQQQRLVPSDYGNFFCRECGCPLADRYGLHDLEDDDDWREEYETCPVNAQTREWARSLEMLRRSQEESKMAIGRERRRPKHLPKIDTAVGNKYRTGLQHLS